ncbi:unnamed protein product [Cylicostephanus goldi]|uniref:NR LBD domain-containing protein n=1 Tax=Cylicostephanus goldi TaxID=71465 RepID=A0A3P6T366_CYLGO|nr:unnamed protein product [Cylicostephanus goldi]
MISSDMLLWVNRIILALSNCIHVPTANASTVTALHVRFPPADELIVENALTKYRTAMVNHIKYSYPNLDHEAVMDRISALFGVVPYLELLSEIDNMHLTDLIMRNNGNMQGRLTNDIHVNSLRID